VTVAVYFHDEAGGVAVEVGYEAGDHLLAAEVQAGQTIGPKTVPQTPLARRHLPPHPPR
jgi:hypothetical protein